MQQNTAEIRQHSAKTLEQRRQIFDAIRYEGLTRKEVVTRLGVSRQTVDYHLKFRNPEKWEDWAELTQLRNDLADALTREKFHKHLIEVLTRALVWTQLRKMPLPTVKVEGEKQNQSSYELLRSKSIGKQKPTR